MYSRAVWHAQTYTPRRIQPSRYLRRWHAFNTSPCLSRPESTSSSPSDDTHKEDHSTTPKRTTVDSNRQDVPKSAQNVDSADTQAEEDNVTSLNEQLRAARRRALILDQQIQDGGRRRTSMRGKRSATAETPSIELPDWFLKTHITKFQDIVSPQTKLGTTQAQKAAGIVFPVSTPDGSSTGSHGINPAEGESTPLAARALSGEIYLALRGSFAMVEHKAAPSFATAKAHLSLFSPVDGTLDWLKSNVNALAVQTRSDVLSLDAFTLSRLGEAILPRPSDVADHPIRSLSFETHKEEVQEEMEEDEEEDEEEQDDMPRKGIMVVKQLKGGLEGLPRELSQMFGKSIKVAGGGPEAASIMIPGMGMQDAREMARNSPEGQAISGMFEAMFDAWGKTRDSQNKSISGSDPQQSGPPTEEPKSTLSPATAASDTQQSSEHSGAGSGEFKTAIEQKAEHVEEQPRLIIQIADAAFLTQSNIGLKLMDSLLDVVQRRRAAGQTIVIVGISASSRFAAEADGEAAQRRLHLRNAETLYRPFFIAPGMKAKPSRKDTASEIGAGSQAITDQSASSSRENSDLRRAVQSPRDVERANINVRHLVDVVQRMAGPNARVSDKLEALLNTGDGDIISLLTETKGRYGKTERSGTRTPKDVATDAEKQVLSVHSELNLQGISSRILDQCEIHAIALSLVGMRFLEPKTNIAARWDIVISVTDIAVALRAANMAATVRARFKIDSLKLSASKGKDALQGKSALPVADPLEVIRKSGNKYEQRLLSSAVSATGIKTTFDQVHVQPSTIDTLRTLTSLSLQRPDAFRYGVLATDAIPGLLLYGPPGTGKTLLAKAVAKESNAAMLSIDATHVNHMYVGESEKSVKAIFSVARKMAPCVVFIDEADSIFGSRSQSRQKPSHRDTINQFLREWDGLDERSVFLMVATNRPFDLDDAVLRRLARRVLVDLPSKDDREAILRIHLRDEQLDTSVDIPALAEKTPFYSGSDLKNVAVAAALSAVREELDAEDKLKKEQAALAAKAQADRQAESAERSEANQTAPISTEETPSQAYVRPARRTLFERHFIKALEEISASVGEDMASLRAMKKFDEQYGDRKGRRKKQTYGFLDIAAEEKNARVRA